MPARSFKCPECGAGLEVERGARTTTCSYCGSTSQVRKKRRRGRTTSGHPAGKPSGSPLSCLLSAVIGLLITGVLVTTLLIGQGDDSTGPAAGVSKLVQRADYGWQGLGAAILVDLNGDGVNDVVGRIRYVSNPDSIHAAAFDGRTGEQLWKGPSLGTYSDTYQGELALSGEHLVFADPKGRLAGLSSTDGSQLWQVGLGEKPKRLCADEPGRVIVDTVDGRRQLVTLQDGGLLVSTATGCPPLWSDHLHGGGPPDVRLSEPRGSQRKRMIQGMQVEDLLERPADGVRVGLGHKQPGTRIPMVGREEPAWSALVPAVDPLTVQEGAPEMATLSADRLVVVYRLSDRTPMITAFHLEDGRRLWHVPVPEGSPDVLEAIVADEARVFLSIWQRLEVFDAATGEHLYRIGSG